MKVLMIGDVVARPGRVAVLERIQDLREQHAVDLAVMNAENVSGGFSVTPQMCEGLFAAGIDVMTSGNHIFDKREAAPYIARQPRLLRPANYPEGTPGSGIWVGEARGGVRVAVLNLMGRVYMPPPTGCSRRSTSRSRSGSWTCTPRRPRRRSRWRGTSTGASRRSSAPTRTS